VTYKTLFLITRLSNKKNEESRHWMPSKRIFTLPGHPSNCLQYYQKSNFIVKIHETRTKMLPLGPGLVLQKIPSLVQVPESAYIVWAEKVRTPGQSSDNSVFFQTLKIG
jgi:hypothetical protein